MPLSWVLKPVAVASAIAFSALGLLSRKSQRARLYFNVTIFLTTLGAASVWGLLVSVIATASGQRLNINYYVARAFYKMSGPLMGITFDVEGEEHLQNLLKARDGKPQSAVVIGNHQSMLDIMYLGRIFPERTSIMAKQELKWSPLLGQFMWLSGAVFINRKNRKDAVRTVAQAGEDMKKRGVSLWIFPEGTRASHAEPSLLPFKKGAFHLAIQAQVPIVPVVCENYHHLFDGHNRLDGGRLKIKILPPISTVGMTADDVTNLTVSTRDLMLKTLQEISTPSSSSGPSLASATGPKMITPIDVDGEGVRQRVLASAGSPLEASGRGAESTEDEMDDDAVLLKRPKAE